MTNKSAIVIIKAMITTHKSLEAQGINSDVPFDEESIEALNMAIDSLKKPNIHGHWIKINSGDEDFPESIVCDRCNHENSHLDFNEHNEPIGKVFVTSNFCPNCGADMREPEGEKGTE